MKKISELTEVINMVERSLANVSREIIVNDKSYRCNTTFATYWAIGGILTPPLDDANYEKIKKLKEKYANASLKIYRAQLAEYKLQLKKLL